MCMFRRSACDISDEVKHHCAQEVHILLFWYPVQDKVTGVRIEQYWREYRAPNRYTIKAEGTDGKSN